jgi:hypothetical protein
MKPGDKYFRKGNAYKIIEAHALMLDTVAEKWRGAVIYKLLDDREVTVFVREYVDFKAKFLRVEE